MSAIPERVDVQTVKQQVNRGQALLVCAYSKEEKFLKNHLEGAISLQAFEEKKPTLDKNQLIFFYCA